MIRVARPETTQTDVVYRIPKHQPIISWHGAPVADAFLPGMKWLTTQDESLMQYWIHLGGTYIHACMHACMQTLHYSTCHFITWHYITFHYMTCHDMTLHFITLHYTQTYIHVYMCNHVYIYNIYISNIYIYIYLIYIYIYINPERVLTGMLFFKYKVEKTL